MILFDEIVVVGYAGPMAPQRGVKGGSEMKLKIIGFQANEAVGQFSGMVLRLFSARLMVGEEGSFRKRGGLSEIIDCVEKNLQTSYRALPLYFSFPLWNHSLPARLTQFLGLTL